MRLPSPAMVVALIALAVSLGGTSYAVTTLKQNSVGSKQIKPGGVRASDIHTGAVGPNQVRDGSLTSTELAPGTIPTVPSKAADAELLDGKDSTAFLAATGKAADADKLDGLDSTDIPLGWFTGRIINLPGTGAVAGAPSGASDPVATASSTAENDRQSPGPGTPFRVADFHAQLKTPSTIGLRIMGIVSPGNLVLLCSITMGESSCSNPGPSPVTLPANAPVSVFVGRVSDGDPGQDVMFSWRATRP